jgi:hypothetical protein
MSIEYQVSSIEYRNIFSFLFLALQPEACKAKGCSLFFILEAQTYCRFIFINPASFEWVSFSIKHMIIKVESVIVI